MPEISAGHLHQFKSPGFGRGFFVSGRNLADEGLAILRPPIRTASRNRVQRHGSLSGLTCNAVQPYSGLA